MNSEQAQHISPRAGLALATAGTVAVMLSVHVLFLPSVAGALASLTLFLLAVSLLWHHLPQHYPHDRFGSCNTVTLLRAGVGATLVTPLIAPEAVAEATYGWSIAVLATIALSLDGLDGWLARRSGLASGFGARFDMEVDAALALLLSLLVLADGSVGPLVLLLGLMRYGFVAASWALPWMAAPLPERFGRKVVCVIQIAALILLQTPPVEGNLAVFVTVLGAMALIWSFARDIYWLWRHRT